MHPARILDMVDRLDADGWTLTVDIQRGRITRVVATYDVPERTAEQVADDYDRLRAKKERR